MAAPAVDESALISYLSRFNSTFDTKLTTGGLLDARAQVLTHIDYLKLNMEATDVALMLSESMEYAKYRIAQRFGLVEAGADPLIGYATVGSRYMESVGG